MPSITQSWPLRQGRHVSSTGESSIPVASLRHTMQVLVDVLGPTVAKGVIIRRKPVVRLVEWMDLDKRAVHFMQRLRHEYGTGPLMLRIPGRRQALLLSPEHVHRILEETPDPFATATLEKRSALTHFQPHQALISEGTDRAARRRYNEQVLESDSPMHRLSRSFVEIVREEAELLLASERRRRALGWDLFFIAWYRIVRRVVFGEPARDDHELTDMLAELRGDANWAFLKPARTKLRRRFFKRLRHHLAQAAPGSLASMMAAMAATPASRDTAPAHQVPQWLFAFDPAGMATFRALALLAAFPEHADRAREEARTLDPAARPLPLLRATVLESLRLWPTTPLILRETREETLWEAGKMPANTGVVIFAPYFHRDEERLPFADRFAPEVWADERTAADWPLVPFSGGPAICPGRHLVLLVSSAFLASVLDAGRLHLKPRNRIDPQGPLPGTLNNYSLRFEVT